MRLDCESMKERKNEMQCGWLPKEGVFEEVLSGLWFDREEDTACANIEPGKGL